MNIITENFFIELIKKDIKELDHFSFFMEKKEWMNFL